MQEKTANSVKEKGNALHSRGEYQAALDCYKEALSIDEHFKEAWCNSGICYLKLNQHEAAISAFQRALNIDPDYEKARYHYQVLQLPAHILFGIADLKFTADGQVKLLEFGRGLGSDLSGYDRLYPDKPMLEAHGLFLDELDKIKPAFTVYNDGTNGEKNDGLLDLFSQQIHSSSEAPRASRKLSDYKGIFFEETIMGKAQKVNPDILTLDNAVSWYMVSQNKYLMHELAKSNPAYRPQCKIFPLRYEETLAEKIKSAIPGNTYVLKVPDLTRGEGVIVVNKEDLENVLCNLLSETGNPSEGTKRWRSTKSKIFLVEEYCQSRKWVHEGKVWDPTMRVAFIITVDNGHATFKPLGCYWKLPKSPLNGGTLRDRSISSLTAQGFGSVKVNQTDKSAVYRQLNRFLPTLFLKILTMDIPKIIDAFRNDRDDLLKAQADSLLSVYARNLFTLGQEQLAFSLIKTLKKSEDRSLYYTEKGCLYFRSGNFRKSVQKFDNALTLNPYNAGNFFIRAKAHRELGNIQQAMSDVMEWQQLKGSF